MDRPLVQRVIASATVELNPQMIVSKITPDSEGGVRFYLGPDWHGHYVVVEDEFSLELMRKRLHDAFKTNGAKSNFTIPHPPADKFYCERNGVCPCEGFKP